MAKIETRTQTGRNPLRSGGTSCFSTWREEDLCHPKGPGPCLWLLRHFGQNVLGAKSKSAAFPFSDALSVSSGHELS